jgi:chaperonin GroES
LTPAGYTARLALGTRECQRKISRRPRRREIAAGNRSISRKGKVVTTATKVAIKPLEDRIVVQPSDAEETTASGLVIPDTAKEKPQEGKVLAVGPGRFEEGQRVPLDVKVGDTVLYSKYGGTEVKYGGEEYLVLSARDVLAIIEK